MTDIEIQEIESKKRYLKRYRKNRGLIYRLKLKIKNLDDRIRGIRSPGFSDMPRGGTPITKEDLTAEKVDIERRIERLEAKGKIMKAEIVDIIDELEDSRYAEILESFLVDCKDFGDIADDTGYSVRHVERLYGDAIKEIVGIMSE
jgi:hypothetical protein